ncbi:MAG: hypothetical protein LH647_06580 [Leptolyngbyaceae cyanobacterium CAN_BIN12]|nr:hypothetical protein [Leptolyngbyaceae cyanobacterium CAN_BIN12]
MAIAHPHRLPTNATPMATIDQGCDRGSQSCHSRLYEYQQGLTLLRCLV